MSPDFGNVTLDKLVQKVQRVLARAKMERELNPRLELMQKARDAFLHEHATDCGGGVLWWPSLAPLRQYERAAVRIELGLAPGRRT